MSVPLAGARVLLTGATGRLGGAIARELGRRGAVLVLSGRRTAPLEALATELGATAVPADLADRASVDALLTAAGPVDVLVANAAEPATGVLPQVAHDLLDRALEVNLRVPVAMTRAVLPGMLGRGRGQVVLIGSVSGMVSSPGSSLYNAAKFGLRGFAGALRQDLHGSGVGVSVVMPGFVRGTAGAPRGVRQVSPEQVAAAVVRAVERDRGELVVAPPELRAGAVLGAAAPRLAALVQRRLGASDLTGGDGTR